MEEQIFMFVVILIFLYFIYQQYFFQKSIFFASKEAFTQICGLGPESYVVDLWDNITESNDLKAQILVFGRPSWKRINNHE